MENFFLAVTVTSSVEANVARKRAATTSRSIKSTHQLCMARRIAYGNDGVQSTLAKSHLRTLVLENLWHCFPSQHPAYKPSRRESFWTAAYRVCQWPFMGTCHPRLAERRAAQTPWEACLLRSLVYGSHSRCAMRMGSGFPRVPSGWVISRTNQSCHASTWPRPPWVSFHRRAT